MQTAQTAQPSLLARDDTFFGICQGLGEDLGISPQLLRVAFALALFFNPIAAVAGYALAGVVVLASRLLVPNPRVMIADPEPVDAAPEAEPVQQQLPLAA